MSQGVTPSVCLLPLLPQTTAIKLPTVAQHKAPVLDFNVKFMFSS